MNKPTEKEKKLYEATAEVELISRYRDSGKGLTYATMGEHFRGWLTAHRAQEDVREAASILCQAAEDAVTNGLSTTGSPLLDGVAGVRKALGQTGVKFVRGDADSACVVSGSAPEPFALERGGE